MRSGVGVSHGFGPGITSCPGSEIEMPWWEDESTGGDTNDDLGIFYS